MTKIKRLEKTDIEESDHYGTFTREFCEYEVQVDGQPILFITRFGGQWVAQYLTTRISDKVVAPFNGEYTQFYQLVAARSFKLKDVKAKALELAQAISEGK